MGASGGNAGNAAEKKLAKKPGIGIFDLKVID
jgi:hypothetical protein